MVAAGHFYYWFVQTRADDELPYEYRINNSNGMLGNEVEPPKTHALALEDVAYISFYSSRVVCGARRPQKIERHGADEDDEAFPSRKGAEGVHHPHTQQRVEVPDEAGKIAAPSALRVRKPIRHGHGHASHE